MDGNVNNIITLDFPDNDEKELTISDIELWFAEMQYENTDDGIYED